MNNKPIVSNDFKKSIYGIGIFLAVILAAANVLSLFARWDWRADIFSHFSYQYIIGAMTLGIVFALLQKWKWTSVMLAVFLLNAAELKPMVPGKPSATSTSLSVLQYNRLYLQFKNDDLKTFLRKELPDIAVLQEANASLAKMAREMKDVYPYQISEPDNGAFGMVILSRHPIMAEEKILIDGPVFQNFAVRAEIQSAGEFPVSLYAMHTLPPMSAEDWAQRNLELQTISARISEDRNDKIIFAGDWNISPFSPFFHDILATTRLSSRMSGDFKNNLTQFLTPPTWPSFYALPVFQTPLDHILHSDALKLYERVRFSPMGSDHYPFIEKFYLN
jgi:endonuclease/exonuclease/phosphatase (EEP) superfamily protein YafD